MKTRRRVLAATSIVSLFHLLVLSSAWSEPRQIWPPWPEASLGNYRWNQPLWPESRTLNEDSAAYAESWSGYSLRRDSLTTALPVVIPGGIVDGRSRLAVETGAVRFWVSPNWSSVSEKGEGAGPGHFARLLELVNWSGAAPQTHWSLYVSEDGSAMYFSGVGKVGATDFLKAPIAFEAGEWWAVTVCYSPTNSALWLNDQLVAQGEGVAAPTAFDSASFGFVIGSDIGAANLAEAQFDDLTVFDYWPSEKQQVAYYKAVKKRTILGPVGTEEEEQAKQELVQMMMESEGPPPMPGEGGGSEGEGGVSACGAYDYPSNMLWLEITGVSNGFAYVTVHGTVPENVYELLSKESLTNSLWISEGTVYGADGLDWTPTIIPVLDRTNNLFLWARSWVDSDGGGLPDWWQLENFGHLGVDPYGNPDADAWSNVEEYQRGSNPNSFDTPPAPSGFSAVLNITGSNALLSWNSSPGAVVGYVIQRSNYNPNSNAWIFSEIAQISASATTFDDDGPFDVDEPFGGFNAPAFLLLNSTYRIQAVYGSGLSLPADALLQGGERPLSVDAKLVRNDAGRWELVCPTVQNKIKALRLSWFGWNYNWDFGYFLSSEDLAVTNLNSGRYVIPDAEILNHLNGDFPQEEGQLLWVQGVDAAGKPGEPVLAGVVYQDAPCFVDGREHAKQNLLFQLRGATLSEPYPVWDRAWDNGVGYWAVEVPVGPNYVESGFLHQTFQFKSYGNGQQDHGDWFVQLNDLWPFTLNYQLHNGLYDPSNAVPSEFVWPTNFATIPAPAVLGLGGPYWIAQDLNNLTDLAVTTNGSAITLQNNTYNLFGLAFQTALVRPEWYDFSMWPLITYVPPVTLAPGASIAQTNVTVFFSQTTAPILQTVGYYFAPVLTTGTRLLTYHPSAYEQPYPLPIVPGFALTNESPLIIASVGAPILVGGWAKQQIVYGDANKFGYLGQYFERAFKIATNGVITTNQTGILSPYGEFFPTEPGPTALVTMTNWGENVRGTAVVHVISLNVDGNHDGVMDFSYFGPDQATPNRPYRFWINDDDDAGETQGNDIPGQNSAKVDYRDTISAGTAQVDGVRDLVDFFPVYLNIRSVLQAFPQNAVSVFLKQEDNALNYVVPSSYVDTDFSPTNCLAYLTDTNVALQIGLGVSATTLQITDYGALPLTSDFVNKIRNEGKGMLLLEARRATTKPLVIELRTNNQVFARAELPLSITGVEQMFRYKNLIQFVLTNSTAGWPDRLSDAHVPNEPETNDKNFVFLHGYNVNPNQARGAFAETFKRMYWSGSRAKFYGVNYYGYESQLGSVTPNLQINIVNAFLTAPTVKSFLDTLTNGPTTVAAHSLGNMVMLSALSDWNAPINKYFMIDAAVAIEAIDGSTAWSTNMIHSDWINYTNRLWASHWFRLFPSNDYRSTLTWSNRLANLPTTNVYNFYSSGEEVLRTHTGPTPDFTGFTVEAILAYFRETPLSAHVWALQEKLKGRSPFNGVLSSTHGGWKFNDTSYGTNLFGGVIVHMSPSRLLK